MRKGSGKLWVTVGIFLVVGVICIIFGMMNDATFDTVDVPLNFFRNNVHIDFSDFDEDDFIVVEEWNRDSIDTIECKADCMALMIRKSEDETGKIYVQDNKQDDIEIEITKHSLFLEDDVDVSWFGIPKGVKVILEIPEKIYDNLSIEIDAGSVQLPSVEAKHMEFLIDAGSLITDGRLKGDDIAVSVDAGHADIQKLEMSDEAVLEVAVGNLEVDELSVDRLNADCEVGNMDLKGIDAKRTVASCEVGNIDLHYVGHSDEYDITTNSEIGNIDVHYSKSNQDDIKESKTMELECEVGNIDVKFEQ